MPSILTEDLEAITDLKVLNLVINGMPSIP